MDPDADNNAVIFTSGQGVIESTTAKLITDWLRTLTFPSVLLIFPVMINIALLVAISCACIAMMTTRIFDDPLPALPDEFSGWKADDVERWDRSTLYQYINGGAELFLSYSFERAVSRRYTRADQPDIMVDIFRMDRPQDAYGVYSLSREEENTTVGQGGQYSSGLLLFWKHRYYISILASPETPESRDAVHKFAENISEMIGETIPLPSLVSRLPEEGLESNSIRYFHHHAWQNVFGFLSNENFLRMNDSTEAVLARYRFDTGKAVMFLLEYKTEEDAEAAGEAWNADAGLENETAAIDEDRLWRAGKCSGTQLILVYRADSRAAALKLLELAAESK